jgi:hypothetical protein
LKTLRNKKKDGLKKTSIITLKKALKVAEETSKQLREGRTVKEEDLHKRMTI